MILPLDTRPLCSDRPFGRAHPSVGTAIEKMAMLVVRFAHGLVLACVPVAAMGQALDRTTGSVDISGKLIVRTCGVVGNRDFLVQLPTVAASPALAKAGQSAGRTQFSLRFGHCRPGATVATYFQPGPSSESWTTGYLLNMAETGAARNVELRLLGSNGQVLPVKGVDPDTGVQPNSQKVVIGADGGAVTNYYVEYIALGKATSGNVESWVEYLMIYP